MRVILLQDVKDLGKKGDIKNVSDGFARNFLLPKKLVKIATRGAILELENIKKTQETKATKDLKKTQKTVSALDGYELVFKEKQEKIGKLYAALTPTQIASALKKAGFNVSKNNIKFEESIKELGEYDVYLEFNHNLEAKIKVIIEKE